MRGFVTLVLAWLLSGFVAGAIQVQLGIAFGAREELIVMMMLLAAMTFVTTVILGVALACSTTTFGVDWTAGVLFAGAILLIVGFAAIVVAIAPRAPIARDDIAIFAETLVPIAVMIPIQWWLVRRHRIRQAARAAIGPGRPLPRMPSPAPPQGRGPLP